MSRPCLCGSSSCPLEAPPGHAGVFGDKSLEYGKDPSAFIETSCERWKSRVFICRLALKQTLVIADYSVLKEFLTNNLDNFYNGLKDNFSELFGHSIMFAEPEEAAQLRALLLPLFTAGESTRRRNCLEGILIRWRDNLDCSKPVNFYEEFKSLSLAYNIEMFMGVEREADEVFYGEVSELARAHWHGVVSIPFSVSVPLLGSGGYKRAMDAKTKLLDIIKDKLENNGTNSEFCDELKTKNDSVMSNETMYNHMLLFSCALIPKGIASVLAMFLEMSPKWLHLLTPAGTLSEDNLECVLLEVLRMFPPFTGGLRVAVREARVGPYHVPAGATVHYSLLAAMRDPRAFLHPEQFLPGRWRRAEERARNLAFSTGPHDCIGRHFAMDCLRHMATFLLEHFTFTPPPACPPPIKQLPVLRPKHPHAFTVERKP